MKLRINRKVKTALIIVGWGVAIVAFTFKMLYRIPYLPYEMPGEPFSLGITPLDYLLLFISSIIAGLLLADLEKVLYGFIGSFVLAASFLFLFRTIQDFLSPSWEPVLSAPFGWEIVVMRGVGMLVRGMFPVALLLIFLGGFIGGFLSGMFRFS